MREVMEGACVTTKNGVDELASTGRFPACSASGHRRFPGLPEYDF